jgi:hypothetical protein
MQEEDFDSLRDWQRFGTHEVKEGEAQRGRIWKLAAALWGRTSDDLQRQLLARHPEIPAGYDLADFRKLHQNAQQILAAFGNPKNTWLPPHLRHSPTLVAGSLQFTMWEARCEIVRRAIEYLELL